MNHVSRRRSERKGVYVDDPSESYSRNVTFYCRDEIQINDAQRSSHTSVWLKFDRS
jgi:hypothetical protein